MVNEQEIITKPRGGRKQLAGGILLVIGLVFLVIGIILVVGAFAASSSGSEEDRLVQMVAGFAAFIAFGISCLFLLPGVIIYFIGRSQAKKAKNQNKPQDAGG